MLKGLHLTLLIGPGVPLPVPVEVLEALTEAQVVVNAGENASGFELKFRLSKNSPLQTLFLVSGGALIPIVRVILVATINGTPEVLIDGVMTHHQVMPATDAGGATLVVKGKDLTALMAYIDFSGLPYPAMPVPARVLLILAKYAILGVVPMVIPPLLTDVPVPTDRIPRHQGKDLDYIEQLAAEAGYVFYLRPGPAPGMSVAYWGPEIRVGVPQPALNHDMDVHTNVETLTFNLDTEGAKLPVVWVHEPITKAPIPIPIPNVSLLNPPLGLIPPIPKEVVPLEGVGKLSPIQAALVGLARAAKSGDVVVGTGALDVLRYGRILKARELVGVRGAGLAFDGLYYVRSVTHTIKRGQYKQQFTLVRNGLISTLPVVPA
ncbi:MAG: FIG01124596: hypothetical protein [uncultured Chloroflexia bacterium]|uniref:Phage protein D n=1 Tax=uncultured Chloroflexia bacterium TaxID=1672391 RepID=A0A6J4JXY0_9CHLR|nr:MAG: FIG01124596: hypothetical protein [uncultured Chloroflexia bacterium]